MWRFILALLISAQINSQILKPDQGLERHITDATIQANSLMFRGPLFQHPIIIIKYAPLHPMCVGLTRKLSDGVFIVDLNPTYDDRQLERTLIHEIRHVYQIHNGLLGISNGCFVWKNQTYPFSTSYRTRPWEIDAEKMVELICD